MSGKIDNTAATREREQHFIGYAASTKDGGRGEDVWAKQRNALAWLGLLRSGRRLVRTMTSPVLRSRPRPGNTKRPSFALMDDPIRLACWTLLRRTARATKRWMIKLQ